MLKNNQIWENTTKIAKLEHYKGKLQAVIFKVKSSGLEFETVVSYEDKELETYLKKMKMRPTNKVLALG